MPAAHADHDAVRREHGYHRLTVKTVVQETPEARSYVLDVPADIQGAFLYQPGQFCTFRVEIHGAQHLRSYSMSSAPETDPDLAVTVKRVAGGLVSNWFHDRLAQGDILEVTKPAGVFCPRPTDRPVVAFCGGSGVTPVMSITKSVLAGSQRPVRLLYANRDRSSVIFDGELTRWAARQPDRLEVVRHFDSDSGFLGADEIRRFLGSGLEADFYICGPGPFMDLVESTLTESGVGADRILIERFLVEEQEKHAAATVAADHAAPPLREVTVIIGGKTATVRYQPGDTLLETARRAALRPPFSCESGNCATCMAVLREGTATMRVNNALTPEEVAEGWILTCQAVPDGPAVTVEYEAM